MFQIQNLIANPKNSILFPKEKKNETVFKPQNCQYRFEVRKKLNFVKKKKKKQDMYIKYKIILYDIPM